MWNPVLSWFQWHLQKRRQAVKTESCLQNFSNYFKGLLRKYTCLSFAFIMDGWMLNLWFNYAVPLQRVTDLNIAWTRSNERTQDQILAQVSYVCTCVDISALSSWASALHLYFFFLTCINFEEYLFSTIW